MREPYARCDAMPGLAKLIHSHGYNGVSVVTTTYNEVRYIKPFVKAVRKALAGVKHEVVIVDDSSPDGTYEEARAYADKAIIKPREGQTAGLLTGIRAAKYGIVVTLDVDLENPPDLIPSLVREALTRDCDILVACRTWIPRVGERLTSRALSRKLCVRDIYSNFRVYIRDSIAGISISLGETFGAELLLRAVERGCRICEYIYDPPPRRSRPRVGGKVTANLRILKVLLKLLIATRGLRNEGLCLGAGSQVAPASRV